MKKLIHQLFFLSLFILASQVHAQDNQVAVVQHLDTAPDSLISVNTSDFPQVSEIKEVAATAVVVELVTISPTAGMTAGLCSVISGVLADFCKAHPGDISCNFY